MTAAAALHRMFMVWQVAADLVKKCCRPTNAMGRRIATRTRWYGTYEEEQSKEGGGTKMLERYFSDCIASLASSLFASW